MTFLKKYVKRFGAPIMLALPLWGPIASISSVFYMENMNVVNKAYLDGGRITEYSDGRGIMVTRPINLSTITERVFDRNHDGVADDGYRAICAPRVGCHVRSLNREELDRIYTPAFNTLRGR